MVVVNGAKYEISEAVAKGRSVNIGVPNETKTRAKKTCSICGQLGHDKQYHSSSQTSSSTAPKSAAEKSSTKSGKNFVQARHNEYDYDENDEVDEDEASIRDILDSLEPEDVDNPTLLGSKRGEAVVIDVTQLE